MSQTTVDTSGRIFGLIKLAFFFYQVAGIIRIGSSAKANYHTAFLIELITLIFNIKLGSSTVSTDDNILGRWCPLQTTNVLLMELLHNSIILWCLLLIISFRWQYIRSVVSPANNKCSLDGTSSQQYHIVVSTAYNIILGQNSVPVHYHQILLSLYLHTHNICKWIICKNIKMWHGVISSTWFRQHYKNLFRLSTLYRNQS